LKWFPTIVESSPPEKYYALDEDLVLSPFHSLSGWNPGHLVWDDFLPIFNLFHMFQLLEEEQENDDDDDEIVNNDEDTDDRLDDKKFPYRYKRYREALLMRYVLPGNSPLLASCDVDDQTVQDCQTMMNKFRPLMVYHRDPTTNNSSNDKTVLTTRRRDRVTTHLTTQHDARLEPVSGKTLQSNLVCAKEGVAGIGALTDHGVKKRNLLSRKNYQTTYNVGRGGLVWRFRNYCLYNMGLVDIDDIVGATTTKASSRPQSPLKIVFSVASSSIKTSNFRLHELALKRFFKGQNIQIESQYLPKLSLVDQVQLAMSSTVFVTMCGGAAVTATFLPKGASLIVFYNETGVQEGKKETDSPARLDWDLLNNLSYLRVHWLPSKSMESSRDISAFLDLVSHEIQLHRKELVIENDL
jgi:hypothetical protein